MDVRNDLRKIHKALKPDIDAVNYFHHTLSIGI